MKKVKTIGIILLLVCVFPVIVYASNRPGLTGHKADGGKKTIKIEKTKAVKAAKKAVKVERKADKLTGGENALTRGEGKKIGLRRVVSEDAQGNYQPGKAGRQNAISKITSFIGRLPEQAVDGLTRAIAAIGRFIGV